MMRDHGARLRSFPVLLLATTATFAGCAGIALSDRAREIRALLKGARDQGAYECAPRELATGESNLVFADKELEQGDYFRAKSHLQLAEHSARHAMQMSSAGQCVAEPIPVLLGIRDLDHDGVIDRDDKCPAESEDKDGFDDKDGCPEPDNDGDGLVDMRDKCPIDAEDVDGFQDEDGCPDPDNDGDGVADAADKCPREAEDRDDFDDHDGCPDLDDDKDGIVDAADKCPRQAGPPGGEGCPAKYTFISITPEKIELRQTIFFQTAKAVIMNKSFALLDEVAHALKAHPKMRVRIEGHTDSRGNRSTNIRLSQARADSVRAYLAGHGIDRDRMDARGFGPDQPIETNKTAAGRETNRRVDFVITQQ